MATRSYSHRTPDPESPVLALNWVSEGGRLRSRWALTSQTRQVTVACPESVPDPKPVTRWAAILEAQGVYLLAALCCFIALFL